MLDVNNESLASEASDKEVNEKKGIEEQSSTDSVEKTVESVTEKADKEVVSKPDLAESTKVEEPEASVSEPKPGDEEKVADKVGDEGEEPEASVSEPILGNDEKVADKVGDGGEEPEASVSEPILGDEEKVADKVGDEGEQPEAVEEVKVEKAETEDSENVIEEKKEVKLEKEVHEVPKIDASKLSLEELVEAASLLIQGFHVKDIKNQIENIKIGFQKKFRTLIKEKKEIFIKEGGNEIDFFYSSNIKNRFDELIRDYKRKRQQHYKDVEREQSLNLETRLMLIDELKDLIDKAEASTMYKNFRNLQDRWREVGQIPHSKYNDVWRTYHHHVERFYDLLHLNNDFRDLDFKHNLEEKNKLIEKAEDLAESEDVNHAFKELQILHRLWKEDIGPVAREKREEVWGRFSEATKKIHKKRHEFQDRLEEKYKANVGLKLMVVEKINNLNVDALKSHKAWQDQIAKMEALRNEFFAIGKVPNSKNEEVWQAFREATRKFNSAKNGFYKGLKNEQSENLKKKMTLVEQAESLKDSEDWQIATEVYKKIQADWKKIGHVPRRDSDRIWKRFKDACNHFFDRLHEKQNGLDKDQAALIEKKKEFLEAFKSQIEAGKELTLDFVNESQKKWRELGVLPHKVKHLEAKFFKAMDGAYKKLNIDKEEAGFLRFKSSINDLLDHKNTRKLDSEQLFIKRKIDELTKEIKQLENNISFISNASEDNPLVQNVYKNIEASKEKLDVWKRKIDYIRKLDY